MGGPDNGVGVQAQAEGSSPPPPKRRWFKLGKGTSVVLSIETLIAIVLGSGVLYGVWYNAKARADTLEVRVKVMEDQTQRRDQLFDHGMDVVQTAQVTVSAMQVEIAALKKERDEDRTERVADREKNAADHATILGEIRMIARSREPR